MPPNPHSKRVFCHALHGTKRYANRLTFLKLNLEPTPPPRNESLDTPLSQIMLINSIYPHNKYECFLCCCVHILIDRKKNLVNHLPINVVM